ncbi:hypothetical protein [Entomospira culicis]|uniref:Nucleotide modification associated domain-containing protein n=1 Tax=Entomospira culicis TaxID=2719989 RepID=A0A968GHK5_9SPIO|nr:hypothetical protein [Entomospira culicis]NIZ18904.1 hypothetical protein [Entomospira culicis]NIZ69119.1 hypothetical protein [Entomospira culicis]WDI37705.1 hypothetical protein PVA46_02675 [Entomospira culicis]WDI39333.1 hypothetical protein PVA47_02680 [Entomospira culicis]
MIASIDKVYSYIVAQDNGYSPNPFWGVLSLPWCKPTMRTAIAKYNINNPNHTLWLVGLTRKDKTGHNRVLYLAQISEILSHHDYFFRYPQKQPKLEPNLPHIFQVGDNVYQKDAQSTFTHKAIPSVHSNDEAMKKRDLSSPHVLLSFRYVYYGKQAPVLPENLQELTVGQGFKSNFSEELRASLQQYIDELNLTENLILAPPHIWPDQDDSWQQTTKIL